MRSFKYFKFCLLFAGLTTGAYVAWSANRIYQQPPVTENNSLIVGTVSPFNVADDRLVAELDTVLQGINPDKERFTMEGMVKSTNPSDTSSQHIEESFVFSRSGDNFYYRMGQDELINGDNLSINISHLNKTVFVGEKKQMAGFFIISPQQIKKMITEDGFQLTVSDEKDIKLYRLVNEHSAACHEYQVTYSKIDKQVVSVYTRIPSGGHIEEPGLDIQVEVLINRVKNSSELKSYLQVSHILDRSGALTAPFANYELIKL